jgi:hypothetical protein
MANWWDAAPLVNTDVSAQSRAPKADANWWEAAPLAQEASPARAPEAPSAPQAEDMGALRAAGRGAVQGLTANFGDEMKGIYAAGGGNPDSLIVPVPADYLRGLIGVAKYLYGDPEAKARYEATVAKERGLDKQAAEQHPVANTVGQIGGAMVVPAGAAAKGAALGGRMLAGAGTGALMGGLSGAGEGEGVADTIAKAGTGAVTGAALGGAAPAIIEGVTRAARAVAQPIANTIRGIRNGDDEAARRIALGLEQDMRADPTAAKRLTANEFVDNTQNGGPAAIIDVGGEKTRALARSAANTSPEGRAALEGKIDTRYEGQTDRVNSWLRKTFNYPDAAAQQSALTDAARNVNRPAYQKAYDQGAGGLWDEGLEQISQAPVVQDAIRKATITGANDAAKAGFTPVRNPFAMNRETGRMELRTDANGTALPNLQFWDTVKKNLDKVGTRDAQDFSRVLRDHLDTQIPAYAEARAGAAHFFGASDALEAGQKFVTSKMDNAAARNALAKMSPTERKLFQDGFVSQYQAMLNEVGDRRNILNKIADSPAARERLEIAMGREKAAEFEALQRVEGIMDLARKAVTGNSTTARQLAELGLAGGAYGFSGGASNPLDPSAMFNAALVYGAARGRNKINEGLSRRVAEMLASNDPQVLLRGVKVVTKSREMFDALRAADRGLARVGGEQAPTGAALQAAGVGRADEQQGVPRPPGQ